MCVQTKNYSWERPAIFTDIAIIEKHFPEAGKLSNAFMAMSVDGFQPLTSDLVVLAAMLATKEDQLGMREVVFSGLDSRNGDIVKLPVMKQIVEWLENTALGADMWKSASDWCEVEHGSRVHFSMNCSCGLVDVKGYQDGSWKRWLRDFNASRHDVVGRTNIIWRDEDSIEFTDIRPDQLLIWKRIRKALESLPAVGFKENYSNCQQLSY